ncbi:Holliday junction resolvase RuvX [Cryobacterium sp. 1639]|uniref:Holliday junction resolvase RuvX n=1 Tax=Cryobacterium inferilacus TaxID=2866629 RepID=UPI001C72DB77|nr:Holliday junction resolvase RuvX [Cryobacterium sp. 1639]MBX0298463.1 Holliday junction resolvase RuvX [Cryobacterium sp. 1639]
MRTGVRVGIDVGTVRIGVARSDFHGMLATPVETVQRGAPPRQKGSTGTTAVRTEAVLPADLSRISGIIAELDAVEVIVGLPLALSGRQTASTEDALRFAEALAAVVPVPVRLVDERLSTVSAQAALRTVGRSTRTQRPVVDQVAATIILQHALDTERASGQPAGAPVERTGRP